MLNFLIFAFDQKLGWNGWGGKAQSP